MEDTDISSEPAYREETVTDIDFSYPSGLCQFTLHKSEGDTLVMPSGVDMYPRYIIHQKSRGQSPEEDIVLFIRQLEWVSVRDRVIKWPVKKPITVKSEPAPPSGT